MDQYRAEKLLALFYPAIAIFSGVTAIASAVAWNHWKYVLDVCVEENCGCILNGRSTPTYFVGGHVSYCHFAVYGPLIPIIFCLIFGSFHVYRVCISGSNKPRSGTTTVRQKSGDIIVMTTRSELEDDRGISPNYWIPNAILSSVLFVYTLVHASLYLDGLLRTCRQYRSELLKYMNAAGNMVGAIQGRIGCTSVLDFMDYIHPDVNFERRRIERIDTSAALIVACICSWLCVGLWVAVVVVHSQQARKSRLVRV